MQPAPGQVPPKAVANQVDHRQRFKERQAQGLVQQNPPSGQAIAQPIAPRPQQPQQPGQPLTLAQQMQAARTQGAQGGAVEITGNAQPDPQQTQSMIPPPVDRQQPQGVVTPDTPGVPPGQPPVQGQPTEQPTGGQPTVAPPTQAPDGPPTVKTGSADADPLAGDPLAGDPPTGDPSTGESAQNPDAPPTGDDDPAGPPTEPSGESDQDRDPLA